MQSQADLARLKTEYEQRETRLAGRDLYSCFNPANLFILQQRQREVLKLLKRRGFDRLEDLSILELGCGKGGVLQEFLSWGAASSRLFGFDLIPGRVRDAHDRLPHLPLAVADGQNLPYPSSCFDLVLQYTVFTSVLDDRVKQNLAAEMLRLLRPGGLILWYDFWLNPTNPQTRGIKPVEIRRLFPGCTFSFNRITLAPPIARRLVPISWQFCAFLEKIKLFNTHYLVAIRPDIR